MGKVRYKSIDFLKGIAIMLVVLGHSILTTNPDYINNRLWLYISSFHIPLFMFVSGMVSFKVNSNFSDIKKRAYQLLIPFFMWPVVSGLIINGSFTVNRWRELLINPSDNGLWFLPVLFFISSFFMLINILISKFTKQFQGGMILFTISLLLSIFLFLGHFEVLGLPLVEFYSIYYIAGAICNKHINKLCKYYIKAPFFLIIPFLILGYFYRFNDAPSFMGSESKMIQYVYSYVTGFLGTFVVLGLCLRFIHQDTNNILARIIIKLGKQTLGIYSIHWSGFLILFSCWSGAYIHNQQINCTIVFFSMLTICSMVTFLLEKGAITSQILLGKMRFLKS